MEIKLLPIEKLIEKEEWILEDESSLQLINSKGSEGKSMTDKLLGVLWDSNLDKFRFKVKEMSIE